jgi:DNA-binding IclR family transcriptional regulator
MPRHKRSLSRQRALPRAQLPPDVVKSAARTMQILELLDDLRRPVSLVEVAEALGYPQSSTSALLHTLSNLGYLAYDERDRTYLPSSRVTLLGNWAHPELFGDGALLRMMAELNRRSGDSIVLAVRHGAHVRYLHVVQATSPARLHLTLGSLLPLAGAGTGLALLSTFPEDEVWRIVAPLYAPGSREVVLKLPELRKLLAEYRKTDVFYSEGMVNPGGATMAMALPDTVGAGQPMVVAIAGIAEVMRRRKPALLAMLREEVQRYAANRRVSVRRAI